MLLFQEYDFKIVVKLGHLNAGPDHLSPLKTNEEPTNLEDGLPDSQLYVVHVANNHFEDIIHFLNTGTVPQGYSIKHKNELVIRAVDFTMIAGHLYKMGNNEIIHRYGPKLE